MSWQGDSAVATSPLTTPTDPTARALLEARRARRVMRALPDGAVPAGKSAGITAQVALASALGANPPAGFKIGATTAAMQAYLGLDGPLAGFMPEAGLHGSGSTLAYAGFVNPGVECEIAVHLGRDLPAGCTLADAAAAVDGLMASIELVERRYEDLAAFGVPALVADQVFHAAVVLGQPYPGWDTLDLAALRGELLVDGTVQAAGTGAELMGGPMHALAWLAGSEEAAAFGGLRAGQVVTLGSVTPPIWLERPCTVTVRFPPLEPVHLALV